MAPAFIGRARHSVRAVFVNPNAARRGLRALPRKQRGPRGCPRSPRAASNLLCFRRNWHDRSQLWSVTGAFESMLFSTEVLLHPFGSALAHFLAGAQTQLMFDVFPV